MGKQIAIDGPAGAGKSTIARKVAEHLHFIYVDTGAMYRAIALFLLREGTDLHDADAVAKRCGDAEVEIGWEQGEQVVFLNGENVNGKIRTEEVSAATSLVSTRPVVREKMVDLQRALAERADVVMDGRDIGTCVLPNAEVKIYLTADVSVRAKRRFLELQAKGEPCALSEIERDIAARDEQDMNRAISPLKQADDAILVDTSAMTPAEVEEKILQIAAEKGMQP